MQTRVQRIQMGFFARKVLSVPGESIDPSRRVHNVQSSRTLFMELTNILYKTNFSGRWTRSLQQPAELHCGHLRPLRAATARRD